MIKAMFKKAILLTGLMLASLSLAGQNIGVSGTVFDSDGTTPLPYVGVMQKGTLNGVITDDAGKFSINVPVGSVLSFEYLGYQSQEIQVTANMPTLSVVLSSDSTQLDEVVVTALGITRAEKSLGYAVTKVDSESLNNTVSGNWLSNMSGKVAGLNFESASAGPGGSVRVTLRGEGSLSHDKNTALFVIDGVPMNNGMTGSTSGSGYNSPDAPIDYGNGASDLNPEDIASISVLKGPAATALYGSQAANGAIIITTKSGKESGRGLGVTINSSITFDDPGFWPDFQNEYGAGNGNASYRDRQRYYSYWTIPANMTDTGEKISRTWSRAAWGPRLEGQMFYNYNGTIWDETDGVWSIKGYERTPWVAQDWYKGAFRTGITYTNNVSISNNDGKGNSIRFSFRDTRNDWIMENIGYSNQTFNISVDQKVGKWIKLGLKATYYRRDSDNLPTTGWNTASPFTALKDNSPSINVKWMRDEYFSGRYDYFIRDVRENGNTTSQTMLTNYNCDNIYKILYENLNSLDRDRVYGNANITVDIAKGLSLMLRSGIDFSSDFRTQRKASWSTSFVDGYYKEQTVRNFQMTHDAILSYEHDFKRSGISLRASIGASSQTFNYNNNQLIASRLEQPNVYLLQNSKDPLIHRVSRSKKMINSIYGTATLSWREMIYLDITGRNDWSSTLAPGNWSYFYPSVSLSFLVDQALGSSKPSWMDMLKVRGSWANVGNDTNPYNLVSSYSNSDFTGGYYLPASLQNYNLKPENIESWEGGVELHAFKSRLSLDVAGYWSSTTNQIITIPTDYLTGVAYRYINAGKVNNSGVEVTLSGYPIDTRRFKWNVSVNWSKNWNRLVELAPGVELWQMNGANDVGNRVYIYAYPGTELGRLYGQGYKRAPQGAFYMEDGKKVDCSGQIVIDPSTGNPLLGGTASEDLYDFGSIYPKWQGGFSQSFKYAGFTLSMHFTAQFGGKAYSLSHTSLAYYGKLKNSLPGRYEGLLLDGVNLSDDGTYSKNGTIVTDVTDYYQTYKYNLNNVEESIFDTSFLKMKELRLEYSFPRKLMKKTKVIRGASLAFFATNLFCITKWPIYDPEVATLNGSSIDRGMEAGAYPMTRSYGANIKLSF